MTEIEYDGEDGSSVTIYAWDAREAAEEYAQQADACSWEYLICSGKERIVTKVQRVGYDEENIFIVSGEMVPQYSADEILESELVEGRIGVIV